MSELEESRKKDQEKHSEQISGLQQQIQIMEKGLQMAKQVSISFYIILNFCTKKMSLD